MGYNQGLDSHTWAISSCLAWGSTVSFSLVPMFDKTVYKRQRKKHGFSLSVFYAGHVLLHIVPCVLVSIHFPQRVTMVHCWMAHFVQLTWAWVAQGSIYLNDLYVFMEKRHWEYSWAITFLFHYTPLFVSCLL